MSIQFLPNITPSRSSFKIVPASKVVINPFSRVETPIQEPGDKWMVSLQWRFLTTAELRQLRAFLHSLRGQSGMCYIRDTAHSNLGTWPGTPKVYGANQYGNVLTCNGFTASRLVAKAGDRFTLNDRLHELTQDATSNTSGVAVLRFEPEIITPPANGTALIHGDPFGRFYLSNPNDIPDFSQNAKGARDVRVSFTEALR